MTETASRQPYLLPSTGDAGGENGRSRINRTAARLANGSSTPGASQPGSVCTADQARRAALDWIQDNLRTAELQFGLPEVDDRYAAWRVALTDMSGRVVGEVMIRCADGAVLRATRPAIIQTRLGLKRQDTAGLIANRGTVDGARGILAKPLQSSIVCGDARAVLRSLPEESVDLVITSPPYFNAKPEYSEYADYEEYLQLLKHVFQQCHRALNEGRFFVVNASPVLVRRPSRQKSSRRIPVPFHMNSILEGIGFEFLDDVIWIKPAGAGWNTGRGRRFAADRHPLQYKPVPVTEYFLVYRKKTDKLIDWNIRSHPDKAAVRESRIEDGYEVTNVWYSTPAHHRQHPAVFPQDLIEKFVRYYSFKGDIVLDPFAGVGTVGRAAIRTGRRLFMIDISAAYCRIMRRELDLRS